LTKKLENKLRSTQENGEAAINSSRNQIVYA